MSHWYDVDHYCKAFANALLTPGATLRQRQAEIPAGQSDWHLPSCYERLTLADIERFKIMLRQRRKEREMTYSTWPWRPEPFQSVHETPKPTHLMTPQEVKDRLAAGEDPLLLSLEHWVQNAAWIKEHGSLPSGSSTVATCALCRLHRPVSTNPQTCPTCPLGISQDKACDARSEPATAWRQFFFDPSYDNAMNMVAVLASLKPPEPKVPQFYIDGEGEGKVALRLAQRPDGRIVLEALTVSRTGRNHWWCLLDIDQGGSVRQPVHISPNTGLDLDDAGRLKLQRET